MSINEIIIGLMAVFLVLGALDRIAGNRFGLGERFEEGIQAMGALALAAGGGGALRRPGRRPRHARRPQPGKRHGGRRPGP